uniref:Putative secreted protein n=1 Tax=Ixodes ricinus TaxID=34613 RepID=A0A6B0U9Z1_IXORI
MGYGPFVTCALVTGRPARGRPVTEEHRSQDDSSRGQPVPQWFVPQKMYCSIWFGRTKRLTQYLSASLTSERRRIRKKRFSFWFGPER